MKSYSFYFNTSDWLASQAVKEMSKAERGVFICLLALAWERKNQLPASEERVRRLAEMSATEWAESREIILDQFPISACETYRFNKRLQLEVDKEEAKSKKASSSAAARWECERNANASKKHANASKKNANASPKHMLGDAQEQVQVQGTTDVVPHEATTTAPEALPAKTKSELLAGKVAAEGLDTFTAETWIGLNDPQQFALICKSLTALKLPLNLDTEAYRESIRRKVADRNMNVPATSLRNFIESFFMKLPTAELRTVDATLPTVPTPAHELPPRLMERPGQIIAIAGIGYDQTMNRMKIETAQNNWPTAQIHAIIPR